MILSLVQFCPVFGDIDFNTSYIVDKINTINCDIIVFPELCTTGYDFIDRDETESFAVDMNSDYMHQYQSLASQLNKIIVFGFVEKQGDKLFNSAAMLFPDKKYTNVYRKTHLFFRERFCFNETDKGFFVVNYPDWDLNIGSMICYDWRFPEAARTIALKGADIIVCPSNLVTPVWHLATPARALENKVYLGIANRTGVENRNGNDLLFNGMSVIYNYNGSVLAQAPKENDFIITSETMPEETRNKSFNEFNNIFNDRRTEFYL